MAISVLQLEYRHENLVVVYVNLEMPKSYTKRGFDDAGVFHSVDERWRWKGIRMCHLTLARWEGASILAITSSCEKLKDEGTVPMPSIPGLIFGEGLERSWDTPFSLTIIPGGLRV
jgi:hypothetical protein